MAPSQWTKTTLERYIKEGRGQGELSKYQPWKTTYDYSSKGRVTRLKGIKTGRIHQLQSDNQYRAFLIFEFNSKVKDIRESYPLLDVMKVIDNKDDLRFDKFVDKETKVPYVLTTNFLLTVKSKEGRESCVARSVKNSSELKRKITFEKLEIERRYWLQKGVDWRIITEKQLPRQLAKNIEWVRETLLGESEGNLNKEELSLVLFKFLIENGDYPLKVVLSLFDKTEGVEKGTGLFMFRYLLAKKELQIDMTKPIDLSARVIDLMLEK